VATDSGQVATWTVLFTDMVGSTKMRVRVGEGAFDRVRADLDRRVARAVASHDGAAVKSTGDGVMAAFEATASALRCATAIQSAVADHNRQTGDGVALRVGLSVGDAVVDDGDLQGTAVVEAARLCAVAEPGTVLCSDAVRSVSANRSGCVFGEPRTVELKGLPDPVVVHEVVASRGADRTGGRELSFRVLGPLEVELDGRVVAVGGPKERLVLAVLLAGAGTAVSVDALVDAVWGESPPRTAERTVHAYIARLRRVLEPGHRPRDSQMVIETVGRGYRLSVVPDQLDAGRFEQAARAGAERLRAGDPIAAATALRAALAEWRGDAYRGLADVGPCAAEAARLEILRLAAVDDRVDADLASGQAAALVAEIEAAVVEQPFREHRWGQLMVALYRSGRQRDALAAYQRARGVLVDELGVEPGQELRRLEAAILDQDPVLDWTPGRARSAEPGGLPLALAAVGSAFVGRDHEIGWLRSTWAAAAGGDGGFVSILGPEGAGKTRLIAEIARKAQSDGALVLYGRCDHAHQGARALVDQALGSAGAAIDWVDPAGEGADLATAVSRHLQTCARGRPVMLVLDDLHVANAETLEFVADLAGWCRAAPMLVVGAFRNDGPLPADRHGGDEEGNDESRLVLGPLGAADVADICRIYEPDGWTTEDIQRVAELSEGIPLLVHEQASTLARDRTARRVEQAAGRLAATRGRLLTSRGEVADGVETIQRLLEQRRAQLAGRQAQQQAVAVASLAGCPYKGLARFEAVDADNFFGRERLVAELVARVSETSLVMVVGPSGSGKSSLVRAGLLPALAAGALGDEPWRSVALCPGAHPTAELAGRLRGVSAGGAPRVVLIDQFEETFTLGAEPDDQVEFIDRLLALSREPSTTVVLVLRADYVGQCAEHAELATHLAGNGVLVGPMRDSELRRTVELPAQRAGLEVEAGLVEVIVGDVAGRAGALPLLSTALAETWERREGRRLTLAGYRAAGGVHGALARLAEDGYATIPVDARPAAQGILLRLCDAGDDGAFDLRRRLPLADVVDDNDDNGRAAFGALVDRRLLAVDGDTVEVAHESLMREWPRLRTWLEEDVEGRRVHRRLGDAARAWDADARDPSELYRGTRLDAAIDWAAGHAAAPNRIEQDFLDASTAERDAERRREAGRVRRLRALLVGVALALVVSLVSGAIAVAQRDRASDRGRLAEARELAAAANANLDVDPERSVLLALEAVERSRTDDDSGGGALPEAEEALHSAVARSRTVLRVPGLGGSVDWSPQGDTFATEGPEESGEIDIRNATTGESVRRFPGHDPDVNEVVYSPNGELLLTTGDDGAARLWDPATGEQVHAIEGGGWVWGPSFSADGRLFAAAWRDEGVIRVADVATGAVVREIGAVPQPSATSLSPDGARIVASGVSWLPGPAKVVDVATGAVVFEFTRLGDFSDVAWSPDGASIAGSGGGGATVWDAATGRRQFALHGHGSIVEDLDWSPDSNALATAGEDGTARIWILLDGGPFPAFSLTAHDMRSGVGGVSFSPDGTRLLTGDRRVTNARVWDLAVTAGAEIATVPKPAYAPGGAVFLGDGQLVAAASAGNTVTVWDTEGQDPVRTLGGELPADAANPRRLLVGLRSGPVVFEVAADPAGERVAALRDVPGSTASEVVAWDPAAGRELFRHTIEDGALDLAWSPDGSRLAVTDQGPPGDRGHVTVYDGRGEVVGEVWDAPDVRIGTIAFSADGERIVGNRFPMFESDAQPAVHTWDWRTGEVVDRLATPDTGGIWLSDDGALAASVLEGEQIAILDVVRGREVTLLTGLTGDTFGVDFSADGATVAIGGSDGSVRLWDARDGRELVTLQGHVAIVESLDFSRDGSQLVSTGDDGKVRVWTLRLDELEEIARDSLTRGLTTDECQRYLHVERCPEP
jgi:WD40 repeat protein/DNA-binding SARP family transcriptional activator/class 3 adenylate cyclase